MNRSRLRAYFLLIIVSLIWGIAAVVIKFTQRGIETLPFLTYRFAISAVVAIVFLLATRPKFPKNLRDFTIFTIYGVLVSAVSLGFLFWGIKYTTVIESQLISATAPIVASFLGALTLKEHITKKEKIGIGIAFLGTMFIIFNPFSKTGINSIHIFGNILIFSYVLFNAVSSILSKKLLRKGLSPLTLTNFGFIAGFVAIFIFSLFRVGGQEIINQTTNLSFKYHLGVIYMALISGTLAYTLANIAQKTIEVGEASVFAYLVPVFGVPAAIFWLDESLTPNFIIGALIIAVGVVIAESKKRKK